MEDLYKKILEVNRQNLFDKILNKNWFNESRIDFYDFEDKFRKLHFNDKTGCKSIFYGNSLESYIIKNRDRIIEKYKLKKYDRKINTEELTDEFLSLIQAHASILEYKFSKVLLIKFINILRMKNFIRLYGVRHPEYLFKLSMRMNRVLHEMLKEYMIGLIEFYYDYPGLQFLIICTPQSMMFKPFLNYYECNTNILTYSKYRNKLQYLSIVYDRVHNRNFDFSPKLKKQIIKSLTKLKNNEEGELSEQAEKIRRKLYGYAGFKCPDHLIYTSLIKHDKAEKLAGFIINRYFEEGTSESILTELLRGISAGIDEELVEIDFYKNNPHHSKPLIIKYKRLGYIAYMYDFLIDQGLITHDHLWKSISKFKCFKIRRADGKAPYLKPSDISSSKRYKKLRRLGVTATDDKELDLLHNFLVELFPKKVAV